MINFSVFVWSAGRRKNMTLLLYAPFNDELPIPGRIEVVVPRAKLAESNFVDLEIILDRA